MATIYRSFCPATGKFYVGQTRHSCWQECYRSRWDQARSRKRRGKILNLWEKALLKHGQDGLQFADLVTNVHENDVDDLERFFIALYRANDLRYGYNLESGGNKNKKMSESTKQLMKDAAPKFSWFHKNHGKVEESYAGVARLSNGLSAGSFLRLRRGDLRCHRGWVSLEAIPYKGKIGRCAVWRHENGTLFVGTAKDVDLFCIQDGMGRSNRNALSRVRKGKLPYHKGWSFVSDASVIEELSARIRWAESKYADVDLRKGIATRGPNVGD